MGPLCLDPGTLVPLPPLQAPRGSGLAVCLTFKLGVLVASDDLYNALRVFALPICNTFLDRRAGAGGGAGAGAGAGLGLVFAGLVSGIGPILGRPSVALLCSSCVGANSTKVEPWRSNPLLEVASAVHFPRALCPPWALFR
jgi:hypothetical protein